MGKKSGSGSGMYNPDHISESLETIFFYKNPGWKKFGSVIRIRNTGSYYVLFFAEVLTLRTDLRRAGAEGNSTTVRAHNG
jgi:hypothetical protein